MLPANAKQNITNTSRISGDLSSSDIPATLLTVFPFDAGTIKRTEIFLFL